MLPFLSIHGGLALPTYGLIVFTVVVGSTAWLTGYAPASKLLRPRQLVELIAIGLVVGLLAARIALWALLPREQGLSITLWGSAGFVQAGALGGLFASIVYLRLAGRAVLPTLDALIPVLPLAQAGGRIGCLAAGCCYGSSTDVPWAIIYTEPAAASMTGVPLGVPLHPAPLYAAAMSLLVFMSTIVVTRRAWRPSGFAVRPGLVLGVYLIGDGVARLVLEPFRADWPSSFPVPPAVAFAVLGVLVGSVLIVRARSGGR